MVLLDAGRERRTVRVNGEGFGLDEDSAVEGGVEVERRRDELDSLSGDRVARGDLYTRRGGSVAVVKLVQDVCEREVRLTSLKTSEWLAWDMTVGMRSVLVMERQGSGGRKERKRTSSKNSVGRLFQVRLRKSKWSPSAGNRRRRAEGDGRRRRWCWDVNANALDTIYVPTPMVHR